MDKVIEYTDEGLLNRVMFFSSLNEVNIFVEDRDKEYEYQNIIERLFDNEVKIEKIFGLGGKPEVEKAYKEYGCNYDNNINVYIVDGDFDLLLNKTMIMHPNYIYLDRYNIESYYVDKNVILLFMTGKLKKVREQVELSICYDCWRDDTYQKLERLFLIYALVQMEGLGEVNVGVSEYSYLDDKGLFEIKKIDEYENKIKEKISDYDLKLNICKRRYEEVLNADAKKLICGKYILSSLIKYLRKKSGKKIKEDELKFFLLSTFDLKCLNFVKERIMALL